MFPQKLVFMTKSYGNCLWKKVKNNFSFFLNNFEKRKQQRRANASSNVEQTQSLLNPK